MPRIRLIEFDILRSEAHDLTQEAMWARIFELVQQPRTIFLTTPPCHTFSRARHRKPGPPPLRSVEWPRGFPWLKATHATEVSVSNYFIDQSIRASLLAHQAGNSFLWEHPEDLGVAADQMRPASIWQWPEILDLIVCTRATCFAIYQCEFGADFPKPTRILASLPSFIRNPPKFASLPIFNTHGQYLGPLPKHCPHHNQHKQLIGKDEVTGQWKTGPAAAYPPQMCQWLASAIFESFSPTSEAPSSLHAAGGVAPSDDASHARPHLASLGLGPSFDPKPPLVGLSSASRVETRIETASEPSREFEKDKTHFVISNLQADPVLAPSDDASHAQPHPASLGLGPSFDPKPPLVGLSSASRVETRIETASEPSREFEKDKTDFVISNLQADPVPQDGTAEDAEAEDGSSDIPFRPELCGNRGSPLQVEWEHVEAPITDGFGLCSPTRWPPQDRGHSLGDKAKVLSKRLYQMGMNCLTQNVKCPEEMCKCILGGKLKESPFAGRCLEDLRKSWALHMGCADFEAFLSRPTGQPFHLVALSRTAEALEDPDWAILTEGQDSFASGVPVGFGEPTPRVPQVFARKEKWRKLDESDPDYDRANYKSAEMSSEELLNKFREEEKLGRMYPSTVGVLREKFPGDRLRIASMGAIAKPDGSVRPIHDATHGVAVNNHIKLLNRMAVPGPAEMAFAVRQAGAQQEVPLAVSADVSAAHRLFRHRESDHGLLACRSSSESEIVWVNCVGTFGVSSASFWWARLFGIIGRTIARCLLQHPFYQFAYVDDLHVDFFGPRKFKNFLLWLLLHEMVGTPFAYHKFKGGPLVAFIGYELDYGLKLVGLSDARGRWLSDWISEVRKSRWVVQVRRFSEFLGRLGFVSRVVYWIKPHLAPLYAWAAVASKSHVAKLPDTVILTLIYLEETLGELDFKVSPYKLPGKPRAVLHTDAKCADGYVVLGGWDSRVPHQEAAWYAIKLLPSDAPYLFDELGKSQWASASAELLATLVGLWAFGFLAYGNRPHQMPVELPAVTDNRGNEGVLKKQSTTKWPLMLINMQLSHLLRLACLRLNLQWKPRAENDLADQLTNEVFESFDPAKRVSFSFSDVPLQLLSKLWTTRDQFFLARKELSTQAAAPLKRKADKSPW